MPLAKPGAGPWVFDRKPRRAKAFYGTIVAATLVGALMNFTPIDPIRALVVAAVINGVVSVPVMAVMMLVSTRKSAMGVFTLNRPEPGGHGMDCDGGDGRRRSGGAVRPRSLEVPLS